jgi:hypothetical protein
MAREMGTILTNTFRHITSTAAVISILGIATSTVTQQMIQYEERGREGPEEIKVPIARQWVKYLPYIGSSIQSAISEGLSHSLSDPIQPSPPECPSGNCTFTPYRTLSVCAKVSDISHMLTISRFEKPPEAAWSSYYRGEVYGQVAANKTFAYNVSLPNGIYFTTPLSYAALIRRGENSLAFADDPNASNFTALSFQYLIYSTAGNVSYPGYEPPPDQKPWSFRAVEILYHLCVNTYETEVRSGRHVSKVIESTNKPLPFKGNHPLPAPNCFSPANILYSDQCAPARNSSQITYIQDPEEPNLDDPSKHYAAEGLYAGVVGQILPPLLVQGVFYDGRSTQSFVDRTSILFVTFLYGQTYNLNDPETQLKNVSIFFSNIANAISNV